MDNASEKRPWLSIVVPLHNEESLVRQLREDLGYALDEGAEVLVVDNASTDGTRKAIEAYPELILVTEEVPGFGAAVKQGLRHARGDLVAWMPGNLKVSSRDAVALARACSGEGLVAAKARRVGRPLGERVRGLAAGLVLSVVARRNMLDFGGTPTVVPREAVELLHGAPDDMGLESYALWKLPREGYDLRRPQVRFGARSTGRSSWNTGIRSQVSHLLHLIRTVPRYR